MKKVAVVFANGFEEIEALSIVDVLRRADIDALSVGLEKKNVTGAHGVELKTDMVLDDLKVEEFEMIILPGGLPGAKHLAQSEKLGVVLREFDTNNLKIGAICAAPWALSTAGVLKSSYTCYPGFEAEVKHKGYVSDVNVVKDQNIITSRGPATAMEFALEVVKELRGEARYQEVKNGLLFK
ncbi:DJ-1 family glyoxalase III [Campylobacter geochelonis]|uniref:DJ-1 family glyoxalase III n=1 Tax=Campylobacter geochelonis TaxID=1780362 RepID=UPI000770AE7E|nr:DJ-1 family glyoxalase III [Campylobacter geochelonis]CZE51459.1 DJ-1 family protein [Campylobacter geochelonis]